MKAQFKYAFRAGLHIRYITFALVAGMMFIFIMLGQLNLLPQAALITAVSLGGCGIVAMFVVNIINDVYIAKWMFTAPEAYLNALVPVHRGKTLFAGVTAMLSLDFFTLAIVIFGQVWLSLLLAGESVMQNVNAYQFSAEEISFFAWGALALVTLYTAIISISLFSTAVEDSYFCNRRASGFLGFLLWCATFYLFTLLPLLFAPFGSVQIEYIFISVTLGGGAMIAYTLTNLAACVGLLIITGRLMEKKINL